MNKLTHSNDPVVLLHGEAPALFCSLSPDSSLITSRRGKRYACTLTKEALVVIMIITKQTHTTASKCQGSATPHSPAGPPSGALFCFFEGSSDAAGVPTRRKDTREEVGGRGSGLCKDTLVYKQVDAYYINGSSEGGNETRH